MADVDINLRVKSDDAAVKSTGLKFTELSSAIGLAKQAFAVVKGVADEVIGSFTSYAKTVEDMARVTGSGAEETSRLIQVADDLQISATDLSTALAGAVRKGIDPSVQSIAALSDEYLKLQPGLEQSKFLMDNFGRSGLEMARLMEQGSDAILEMGAAVDDSLIITEDAIKANQDFYASLDTLNDAFEGVKVSLGQKLVPVLTKAADAILLIMEYENRTKGALEEHEKQVRQTASSYEDYQRETYRSVAASTGLTDVTKFSALALDEQAEKVNRLAPDLDIMTRAEWDAANAAAEMDDRLGASATGFGIAEESALDASDAVEDFSGKITSLEEAIKGAIGEELADWKKKQSDISEEISETQDEISKLEALKYLTPEQKEDLEDARAKLIDLGEGAKQANIEHHEAMAGIIYDMAQVRAAADGIITEAEYNALSEYASNMGIVDQSTVDAQYALQLMQDKLAESPEYYDNYARALEVMTGGLDDGSLSAEELARILGILTEHPYDIMVNFTYDPAAFAEMYAEIGRVQRAANGIGISAGGGQIPEARANGGPVIGGRPYIVGERGPEVIVPDRAGYVIPNRGNATTTYNIIINGNASATDIIRRARIAEAYGV